MTITTRHADADGGGGEEVIEAKIEPAKPVPRQRRCPLIPGRLMAPAPAWPPTRAKARALMESCRFMWRHDAVFEFIVYTIIAAYASFMRCAFVDQHDWIFAIAMVYHMCVICAALHIFVYHGWLLRAKEKPYEIVDTWLTWLMIVAGGWCLFRTLQHEKLYPLMNAMLPEFAVFLPPYMIVRSLGSEWRTEQFNWLREAEEEGRVRRRIIAELRARAEGVYVPILVEAEGDMRKEKKYLRELQRKL